MLLLAAPAGGLAQVDPTTLLLTWQRDPTSTMTVQWLEDGEPLPLAEGQEDRDPRGYRIPRLAQATVEDEDWTAQALHVPLLLNDQHERPAPETFGAELHLAWVPRGLLVQVQVRDLVPHEHESDEQLWSGDSVELFVGTGVGEPQYYQLIVASGADANQPAPRHRFYDFRDDQSAPLEVEHHVTLQEEGYTIRALLPWANLGADGLPAGNQVAFQVAVNHADEQGELVWVSWHPQRDTARAPASMMRLELAEEADPPVHLRVEIVHELEAEPRLRIAASPELAGQEVAFMAGDQELAAVRLPRQTPVIRQELPLPAPPAGTRWGTIDVRLDGRVATGIQLPLEQYVIVEPSELTYRQENEATFRRARTEAHAMWAWPGKVRQRVELTGLSPAGTYVFQVPGIERQFRFRTMPSDLSEPVRFAAGGDTRHQQDWMERTNRVAMAYAPDFIVWGGDLAYANGRQEQLYRWVEWFEANYNTLIAEDGRVIPIIVSIGNHEVRGGYLGDRQEEGPGDRFRLRYAPYFFQLFAFPGHPGYNALDFGDYLSLVILDTFHVNPIAGEQAQWLERTLSERQHVPHVFPVYHVPAYPAHRVFDGHVSQRVRDHWVPLFEQYGVEMVFENHDHVYKRTEPIRGGEIDPDRGIVYMGDGAWGVGVRDVHDVDETWYLRRAESVRHAIIVTLHGQDRHILVVSEDGEVIDEYPEASQARD